MWVKGTVIRSNTGSMGHAAAKHSKTVEQKKIGGTYREANRSLESNAQNPRCSVLKTSLTHVSSSFFHRILSEKRRKHSKNRRKIH